MTTLHHSGPRFIGWRRRRNQSWQPATEPLPTQAEAMDALLRLGGSADLMVLADGESPNTTRGPRVQRGLPPETRREGMAP